MRKCDYPCCHHVSLCLGSGFFFWLCSPTAPSQQPWPSNATVKKRNGRTNLTARRTGLCCAGVAPSVRPSVPRFSSQDLGTSPSSLCGAFRLRQCSLPSLPRVHVAETTSPFQFSWLQFSFVLCELSWSFELNLSEVGHQESIAESHVPKRNWGHQEQYLRRIPCKQTNRPSKKSTLKRGFQGTHIN